MSAKAATAEKGKKKKGIKWGRLAWTLFVVIYLINFTRNLFADIAGAEAAIPIIYFVFWVLWLGVEFYLEALFYQSSLVPEFNPWLKAAFAVYYYALQGLAPWDAFGGTEIRFLHPLFSIIGLLVMAAGIFIRVWSLITIQTKKTPGEILNSRPWQITRHPRYMGMLLIMFAAPLVFFSPWAMLATVVVGLPIWYLSIRHEELKLKREWGQVYENFCKNTPLRPRFKR
jgi:protein-S-isoprenylcysteine O-methyltransferase Ste14